MVAIFVIFAIGLGFAAHKAKDKFIRAFCVACCLANLAGAAFAIYEDDPYAFKLRSNDGEYDPNYRPDRR